MPSVPVQIAEAEMEAYRRRNNDLQFQFITLFANFRHSYAILCILQVHYIDADLIEQLRKPNDNGCDIISVVSLNFLP